MRKYIFGIALCAVMILGIKAFADVTLVDNGTQRGRVEKLNVKGATTTRSGMQGTIDLSALSGVNWSSVNGIRSSSINWTDIQLGAQSVSGVNWTFLNPSSDGINWTVLANNAAASNIVCWKSNGQLGKCGTSVSGVNCTACN